MFKTIHWYKQRAKKNAINDFEKDFFRLMKNSVFGKTINNARKHNYINLVTTEIGRNYFVSEPDCPITTKISDILLAIKIKRT